MQDEAFMVIFFYIGISLIFVAMVIIAMLVIWAKGVTEDLNTFVKLMVGLYEQEKAKNDRKDEGGFGA